MFCKELFRPWKSRKPPFKPKSPLDLLMIDYTKQRSCHYSLSTARVWLICSGGSFLVVGLRAKLFYGFWGPRVAYHTEFPLM